MFNIVNNHLENLFNKLLFGILYDILVFFSMFDFLYIKYNLIK